MGGGNLSEPEKSAEEMFIISFDAISNLLLKISFCMPIITLYYIDGEAEKTASEGKERTPPPKQKPVTLHWNSPHPFSLFKWLVATCPGRCRSPIDEFFKMLLDFYEFTAFVLDHYTVVYYKGKYYLFCKPSNQKMYLNPISAPSDCAESETRKPR